MKKFILSFAAIAAASLMWSCSDSEDEPTTPPKEPEPETKDWHLIWYDDFNGESIDPEVWSRTDRGTPDWANTQSKDDRCYEMRNGAIVLKGIVNPDKTTDPADYLTGGIWTKGKKPLGPDGCIQVRARLANGATGAWPAIWMMPFAEDKGWPECGEIDIMERLNHEKRVYQTLHSDYTDTKGNKNPPCSVTPPLDVSDWHTYEVQIWQNSVRFAIDGKETLRYNRLPDVDAASQFPYYQEWYLIIDMQLGGSWVGPVNPAELPVEMEVDWVRYYRYY